MEDFGESHDFQREPKRISCRQQSSIMNGGGGEGKEGGRGIIRKLQKHNLNHSAPPSPPRR